MKGRAAAGPAGRLCIRQQLATLLSSHPVHHLTPLVVSPDGQARYLPVHGPLLGLDLAHKPATPARLELDQVLLMVTDGLIERPRIDLADSLEELRQRAADTPSTPHTLRDALLRHYSTDTEDDIALLAVRRQPIEST
ncbi:SpoIIE family protein phosphatase [Streptomyces sp. NPDC006692]|uniref:SpoIIE family protein phosphatase n=1 Tax=Streptomyces sp. NPDC006692 TaxID=3364758 RepID=UPI0036A2F0C3